MATDIAIYARFASGRFGSFVAESVSAEALTEVKTGGTGLAQTSGLSAGVAFIGDTMTHAIAKVVAEDANTSAFASAHIQTTTGQVLVPIQGGGDHVSDLPQLCRPVRMENGITLQAKFDTIADTATGLASLAVYCTNGRSDVFFVKAVDATKTAMVNAQGASIGESLAGCTIMKAYATYASTYGLNENAAGNGAFYIESAEGALKAMYPPAKLGNPTPQGSPYMVYPVRILQNDTLSVMSSNN